MSPPTTHCSAGWTLDSREKGSQAGPVRNNRDACKIKKVKRLFRPWSQKAPCPRGQCAHHSGPLAGVLALTLPVPAHTGHGAA